MHFWTSSETLLELAVSTGRRRGWSIYLIFFAELQLEASTTVGGRFLFLQLILVLYRHRICTSPGIAISISQLVLYLNGFWPSGFLSGDTIAILNN